MKKRFLEYIRANAMVKPGGKVLAALSGGSDSVCLLHLLVQCREELDIEIAAVHVHHGIRGGEADRDAAFCEAFCDSLGVLFILRKEDVPKLARQQGLSLEEAGRMVRYRIFEEERKRLGADVTAVAHHMDDSAETILLNLFRGSGLRGLSGIAPVRERIVRPLLDFRHQEILHYLESGGIEYCSDSTNGELDYARNRVRCGIVPQAELVNRRAVENMARTGAFVRQADEYFRQMASRLLDEMGGALTVEMVRSQDPLVVSYLFMELLERSGVGLKDLGAKHLELLKQLSEKSTGAGVDLPGGFRAFNEYGTIRISPTFRQDLPEVEEKKLIFDTFPLEKGAQIPKNQYTKWFDYDKIKDTLCVRHREEGDFFMLPSGGKKTVKAYMIDEKIPRDQRDRILVLAEGNHVLWIVGYRISEFYKVSDETENILQVRLDGGDTHG